MKKWIAFLLALALAVGLLSGCSGKDDSDSSQPTESTGKADEPGSGTTDTISAVMSNYYLVDCVASTYQQIVASYGEQAAAYFAYLGLNVNTPLNQQYYLEPQTWAAYFLEVALEQAAADLALYNAANADKSFQITEEYRQAMEAELEWVQTAAVLYGYSSADAYLEAIYGTGANMESYKAYLEKVTVANAYYKAYEASVNLTGEELTQYGEEYLSDLSDTQYTANVRHLLVEFEGGTTDPLGGITYTDENKATAKTEAERLLQLWKDGEATEESFAALVKEHTDDPGSKETGGLYENIHGQTPFVEAFLNWSIDPERKAGDIAIVETEYGYHIMFFSGYGAMTHRDFVADEQLRTEKIKQWYAALTENVFVDVQDTDNLKLDITMAG